MCENQYYNPYKLFVGSFIPNWLMERTEISQGAKLCFARLAQYAGKEGIAFPHQETLAKDLGVKERQVRSYLSELKNCKLIIVEIQGLGKPNLYKFCYNEWFLLPGGPAVSCQSERQDTAGHIYKDEENHIRESYNNNKSGNKNNTQKKDIVPYEKIVKAYNDICVFNEQKQGEMPMARTCTEIRKKLLRARWYEFPDLNIFRQVFLQAIDSDFLSGRTSHNFRNCNIDWICSPTHFKDIYEWKYDNERFKKI